MVASASGLGVMILTMTKSHEMQRLFAVEEDPLASTEIRYLPATVEDGTGHVLTRRGGAAP